MRTIYTVILLFLTLDSVYAQDQIKKIIYEDLLYLNELYNGCIIQFDQKKLIVNGNDTIEDFKKVNTIKQEFNRVSLIKIDSLNGYYKVDVTFDLIPNSRYVGLFSNNIFSYILYKKGNKYYKINGFLISEILLIETSREEIKNIIRIKASKKFAKYIKNRNINKIRKYLSVSILKKINQLGFQFNYNPYVKDILCY